MQNWKSPQQNVRQPSSFLPCSSLNYQNGSNRKAKKKKLPLTAHIVIIGGGVGGLSAALSLQLAGFTNVHVYERHSKSAISQRRDGYGLTLTYNPKGPLAKLGILEELAQNDTPSRSHYIFSSDGEILGYYGNAFTEGRGNGQRGNLRIPRYVLLDVLLDRLKYRSGAAVHWGKRLRTMDVTEDVGESHTTIKLNFDDGTVVDGVDLLIGADGIRSSVRSHLQFFLPSHVLVKPKYLNIFLVLGISNLDHPLLHERGFYTLDGTHRLFTMPYEEYDDCTGFTHEPESKTNENNKRTGSRRTMWQLSFYLGDEDEAMNLKRASSDTLMKEVIRRTESWHDPILDMIKKTELISVWGTALMDQTPVPLIHSKSRSPSKVLPIVLLGDAIHPMSPFKGQGANQALTDGPELAEWLLKSNFHSALLGFEREMVLRTKTKVLASREAALFLHSPRVMTELREGEQEFAGVKEEYAGKVLMALKEQRIGANLGGLIDEKVKEAIFSFQTENCVTILKKSTNYHESDENMKAKSLDHARKGDTEKLRIMSIEHSCSPIRFAREKSSGRSCLFLAALGGHFPLTKWLLSEILIMDNYIKEENSTMIDNDGQNPLHAAVMGGNVEIVRLIANKCRNLDVEWNLMLDNDGNTPIELAEIHIEDEETRRSVVELLAT